MPVPNVTAALGKIRANPAFKSFVSNPVSKKGIITQGAIGTGLAAGNALLTHSNENARKEIINLNANKHPNASPQSQAYNPWTDAKSLALGIGGPSVAALLIYNALNRAANKE